MLTYLLALTVGLGSFGLYMTAFFFPEIHRRYDLIWSGVGLFYALVLWVCTGRITGGLLLGQIASVALLGWFGWQTLQLRLATTPTEQRTQLPTSANSPAEVIQATVEQMRTNFQKSANRSPFAAQLSRGIDRFEEQWISFRSWIKAIQSTLSSEVESATTEIPNQPDTPNQPASPIIANSIETIDIAELANTLEQEAPSVTSADRPLEAESLADFDRSPDADPLSEQEHSIDDQENPIKMPDKLDKQRNRNRRI